MISMALNMARSERRVGGFHQATFFIQVANAVRDKNVGVVADGRNHAHLGHAILQDVAAGIHILDRENRNARSAIQPLVEVVEFDRLRVERFKDRPAVFEVRRQQLELFQNDAVQIIGGSLGDFRALLEDAHGSVSASQGFLAGVESYVSRFTV